RPGSRTSGPGIRRRSPRPLLHWSRGSPAGSSSASASATRDRGRRSGPKMLALSGERTVGSPPYFTSPGHTAQARSILGPGPLLVPEIAGSLATGEAGLAAVRPYVARYLQMPNY